MRLTPPSLFGGQPLDFGLLYRVRKPPSPALTEESKHASRARSDACASRPGELQMSCCGSTSWSMLLRPKVHPVTEPDIPSSPHMHVTVSTNAP